MCLDPTTDQALWDTRRTESPSPGESRCKVAVDLFAELGNWFANRTDQQPPDQQPIRIDLMMPEADVQILRPQPLQDERLHQNACICSLESSSNIIIDSMTSVFDTDASLPYDYDLFESLIMKKRIKVDEERTQC
ncbi:hypothetical protein CLF_111541 [Clonorchis sinensis]|uniref:Uncharacterized protein n=1 Tax=Clonorchis sinensis TaxID=79923 RepID=G7YLR3_CLOSI|nr:hypothetical protein CLF_111541 [Clonorchis sinensis]